MDKGEVNDVLFSPAIYCKDTAGAVHEYVRGTLDKVNRAVYNKNT